MFTCLRARALAEGPRLRFFKLWGTLGIFSLPEFESGALNVSPFYRPDGA